MTVVMKKTKKLASSLCFLCFVLLLAAASSSSCVLAEEEIFYFTGFDGAPFRFDGDKDTVYNLVSDDAFQLNARFGEISSVSRSSSAAAAAPRVTWMTQLGVRVRLLEDDEHDRDIGLAMVVDARAEGGGCLSLAHRDNETLLCLPGEYSVRPLLTGDPAAAATAAAASDDDVRIVMAEGRISIDMSRWVGVLVDVDLHRPSSDDGSPFLEVGVSLTRPLSNPHGILGRSARYLSQQSPPSELAMDSETRRSLGAAVVLSDLGLEGNPESYIVRDGLLGTDFRFNRFQL